MRISDWSSDVCSSDVAGRGCLAGPVDAAAVILAKGHGIRGLDDSKKLKATVRETLFEQIQSRAVAFAIARAELAEIETLNILHATMLAMRRAVEALNPAPLHCLVDGNRLPVRSEEHTSELQSLMRISYAVFCL